MRLLVALILLSILGCGVKGDPLPPIEPAHLGRGEPTFQRAVKKLKVNDPNEENDTENLGDENENKQ